MIKINYNVDLMLVKTEQNDLFRLIRKLNKEVEIIKNCNIEINKKNDGSPVSNADKLVNREFKNFIKSTKYKNYISEENEQTEYKIRSKWKYFWMIDPIDGTKEFINKGIDYTLNIALCENNKPIFSVVSVPATGDIYHAFKGKGAYKNMKKILRINKNIKKLKILVSKSHLNSQTNKYLEEKKQKHDIQVLKIGSSLKLCLLAEGKADIYPRFSPSMEWDTCAAQLILEESGGKIMSLDGKYLEYNKRLLTNPKFIATDYL